MSSSQLPTATPATGGARRSGRATTPAPVVLGRYRLHARLGAGAFGAVWLARDERLERDVAIKILVRERIVDGRFEREARAAARLAHPGIVTLYEAAVDEDGGYLVSELVRGATLNELLETGRLSDRDIVAVGIALCDALSHAHEQGVVHRDVKPSNVLVPEQPASSAGLAKLTDFGVARVLDGDSLTQTGDVLGTLAYMAPEQAEGLNAGAPADLYSLGLVLYEALTGVNPVRTTTAASRARRLGAYLPALRRQRRDLPRELGQGIDLALRPRPRERGTVAELRRALVASLDQVADEPGVVAGSWTRRVEPSGSGAEPGVEDMRAGAEPRRVQTSRAEAEAGPPPAVRQPDRSAAWAARGLASLGAAAAAAWLLRAPLAPAPLAPAAGCLLAAALTVILPRVGWLALAAAASGTALAQGHSGVAIVLLVAMLVPVVLLLRRPSAWPLGAGAPALGLLGLAGAWPALAARAATPWRRAGLGFTGWVLLALVAPIAGRTLYLPPSGGLPLRVWVGSPYEAIHGVLAPLLNPGALAPALVWAIGAVILPWLVGRRSLALDVVGVLIWSATLVAATLLAARVSPAGGGAAARSVVTGAVLGAVIALAPSLLTVCRGKVELARPGAGFP